MPFLGDDNFVGAPTGELAHVAEHLIGPISGGTEAEADATAAVVARRPADQCPADLEQAREASLVMRKIDQHQHAAPLAQVEPAWVGVKVSPERAEARADLLRLETDGVAGGSRGQRIGDIHARQAGERHRQLA